MSAFRRICTADVGVVDSMETAAVVEKLARYQKYLEKCMNDDKVNEKHVCDIICLWYT